MSRTSKCNLKTVVAHIVLSVGLGMVPLGCGSVQRFNNRSDEIKSPMHVQLLYFDGCPNSPTMRENLRAALQEIDREVSYEEVDITTLPGDNPLLGYGAPTVLVNCTDLFNQSPAESSGLACRAYPNGVPATAQLLSMLQSRQGE